jgi:hypothetical protein
MALKATLLPRLMSERRQVTTKETRTALRGMSQPGRTLLKCQSFFAGARQTNTHRQRKSLQGIPRSRANANIWREAVATLLIALQRHMSVINEDMTVAPALLFVAV